jgi:hypothetical protein
MKVPRIYILTIKKPYKPPSIIYYSNYGGNGLHHLVFWRWCLVFDFQSPMWNSKKAKGQG